MLADCSNHAVSQKGPLEAWVYAMLRDVFPLYRNGTVLHAERFATSLFPAGAALLPFSDHSLLPVILQRIWQSTGKDSDDAVF